MYLILLLYIEIVSFEMKYFYTKRPLNYYVKIFLLNFVHLPPHRVSKNKQIPAPPICLRKILCNFVCQ